MKKMIKVGDLYFEPFLIYGDILERVKALANEITDDFEHKNPVFLVVLNGAFRFAADLARFVQIECEWQFVKLSSYEGTKSTGKVRESDSIAIELKGRHIIVVEDIVDTGHTMEYYIQQLEERQPASISLASLLVKEDVAEFEIKVDYRGFSIPDRFVVGYGLDYNELGRNLNDIWQLAPQKNV